jgi:hypothetical protein
VPKPDVLALPTTSTLTTSARRVTPSLASRKSSLVTRLRRLGFHPGFHPPLGGRLGAPVGNKTASVHRGRTEAVCSSGRTRSLFVFQLLRGGGLLHVGWRLAGRIVVLRGVSSTTGLAIHSASRGRCRDHATRKGKNNKHSESSDHITSNYVLLRQNHSNR